MPIRPEKNYILLASAKEKKGEGMLSKRERGDYQPERAEIIDSYLHEKP